MTKKHFEEGEIIFEFRGDGFGHEFLKLVFYQNKFYFIIINEGDFYVEIDKKEMEETVKKINKLLGVEL